MLNSQCVASTQKLLGMKKAPKMTHNEHKNQSVETHPDRQ